MRPRGSKDHDSILITQIKDPRPRTQDQGPKTKDPRPRTFLFFGGGQASFGHLIGFAEGRSPFCFGLI
jgi:hypothetical protein